MPEIKQEPDTYTGPFPRWVPPPPKRKHRERIVGWDGTVWQNSSHSESSTDSDITLSSTDDEDLRPPIPKLILRKRRSVSLFPGGEDDEDEDEEEEYYRVSGEDLDHQQKMARAISSKYRFGGRMPPKSLGPAPKKRVLNKKELCEAASLVPGALVWALMPKKYHLPWWAGVIAARPVKRKAQDSKEMCFYRVILLCPPRTLWSESSVFLPQRNLRPFHGRVAFESFMQSVLNNSKNKLVALKQFTIPPQHERFWYSAREQIELAANQPGRCLQTRFQYLGFDLNKLQETWKVEDERRKQKAAKLKEYFKGMHLFLYIITIVYLDNNRDVKIGKIMPFKVAQPKTVIKITIPTKFQNRILPKDAVFAFEALFSQGQISQSRARFICCVCLEPGQLLLKKKKDADENDHAPEKKAKLNTHVPATLLKRLKTVKPIVRRPKKSPSGENAPMLVPCSGRCANYIHLHCAEERPDESDDTKSQPMCAMCKAGLRQCSICMVSSAILLLLHQNLAFFVNALSRRITGSATLFKWRPWE